MNNSVTQDSYIIYIQYYESCLGRLTMAARYGHLIGLWFENQKYELQYPGKLSDPIYERKDLPVFEQTALWLDLYFSGQNPKFRPDILLEGSAFQKAVWDILLEIPYGQTMSYKQIADIIARQKGIARMSAQAVGNAIGHNPISLIVPCHRVIGSNGKLTGYAGGLFRKQKLLDLEGFGRSDRSRPRTKAGLHPLH